MSIEKELEKYKKRDLESSLHDRVLSKTLLGASKVPQRLNYPNDCHKSKSSFENTEPFLSASDVCLWLPAVTTRHKVHKRKSRAQHLVNSKLSIQDWIAKRKQLRNDLEKFDFNANWLKRKPNRTPLEESVLISMLTSPGKPLPSFRKDVGK